MDQFVQLGFEEALKKTWFCFTPINDKPCGSCNPCLTAIADGMQWRFDSDALIRFKYAIIIKILLAPLRFIKRLYYYIRTYFVKWCSGARPIYALDILCFLRLRSLSLLASEKATSRSIGIWPALHHSNPQPLRCMVCPCIEIHHRSIPRSADHSSHHRQSQ